MTINSVQYNYFAYVLYRYARNANDDGINFNVLSHPHVRVGGGEGGIRIILENWNISVVRGVVGVFDSR